MKPLVFKADSWHHQLAVEWGGMSKYDEASNICWYTRAVLSGMAKVGLILALMFGLLYWVTITLVWWAVVLQYGFFDAAGPVVLSTIVAVVTIVEAVETGIPRLRRKIRDARNRKREAKGLPTVAPTDSFVTKAWRAWKDKTCVRVMIVDTANTD